MTFDVYAKRAAADHLRGHGAQRHQYPIVVNADDVLHKKHKLCDHPCSLWNIDPEGMQYERPTVTDEELDGVSQVFYCDLLSSTGVRNAKVSDSTGHFFEAGTDMLSAQGQRR